MLKWLKNTFSKSPESTRETTPVQLAQNEQPQASPAATASTDDAADAARLAIAIACQKLGLNPADDIPVNLLADQLYEKHLLADAEALYRLVLQARPESLETWINLGLSLDGQSRFEEAVACYRHVISKKADDTIAYFNLGVSLSMLGRTEEAEAAYLGALDINPQFVHAHFNLGILFQQRDHLSGAVHHYQELLKYDPHHYFAYCNLGMIHAAQGRLAEAESCFLTVIAEQPEQVNAIFFLANLYQQQARLQDAENLLKNLLQLQPGNIAARDTLLTIYLSAGRLTDACVIYRAMLEVAPNDPATLYNFGVSLQRLGMVEEALQAYQQALQFKPDFFQAYGNIGVLQQQLGRLEEAKTSYQRSLEFSPQFAVAHTNLGHIYKAEGQAQAAEASYRQAIKSEAGNAVYVGNLAQFLFSQHRYQEAEHYFQQALQLDPASVNILHDYGKLHMAFARMGMAQQCFEQAIQLKPDFAEVHNSLGALYDDRGMIAEAVACYRRALEYKPTFSEAFGNLLFALNYHPDLSAEEIFAAYREYEQRFALAFYKDRQQHDNNRDPQRRLKIGYVSPDFRRHPVQHFLEPLLAQHDKTQVEVYAYAELSVEDIVTARYRSYADHWVPIQHLSDEALANKIRADGIDILIDVAGHTGDNRLRVFARKPAPVSVSWLGYGYTTGLTAIDYFLSDAVFTPEGSDALFAERPWRLDSSCFTYRPAEGMGAVSPLPALSNGYITLGTLSRAVRINHQVIQTWAKLLQRLGNARLVIDSANFTDQAMQLSFIDKFAALGIDSSRLLIGAHSPPWDVLRSMDIGLDCFPHNSGTTLFETLYMGLPFISLAGRPSVGRLGSTILHGLGRPEWIANSEEEYIEKVLGLAANLDQLSTMRMNQRQQMQNSILMDESGFTRKVETAYRSMWQAWCRKQG